MVCASVCETSAGLPSSTADTDEGREPLSERPSPPFPLWIVSTRGVDHEFSAEKAGRGPWGGEGGRKFGTETERERERERGVLTRERNKSSTSTDENSGNTGFRAISEAV